MLKINTYEQSKKITNSIFKFLNNKDKNKLSKFRTFFASQFGYSELQDAYKIKQNELKEKYISFLDDPRVTIEVARIIRDDYDKAETYFDKHFQDNNENILFPITNSNELLLRCEEILILWNEIEFFSRRNLFSALLKLSFDYNRISYEYFGNNPNKELLMAQEFLKFSVKRGSLTFIENLIDFQQDDICFDSGFDILRQKFKIVANSVIWTHTNCGYSVHDSVSRKHKELSE